MWKSCKLQLVWLGTCTLCIDWITIKLSVGGTSTAARISHYTCVLLVYANLKGCKHEAIVCLVIVSTIYPTCSWALPHCGCTNIKKQAVAWIYPVYEPIYTNFCFVLRSHLWLWILSSQITRRIVGTLNSNYCLQPFNFQVTVNLNWQLNLLVSVLPVVLWCFYVTIYPRQITLGSVFVSCDVDEIFNDCYIVMNYDIDKYFFIMNLLRFICFYIEIWIICTKFLD